MTPRERCLRVLLRLLSHPYRFSLPELAKHFEQFSTEGIKSDIREMRRAGLHVDVQQRDRHVYAILPEQGFRELEYLQALSDSDRARIGQALQYLSERDRLYLTQKLESLYDWQLLGLRSLRRPAIDRLDKLEAARKQKRQVLLINYRSNSGTIRDRRVEPFFTDPELDTLQAYDVDPAGSGTKHFLLSRIERVELTHEAWQHETDHRWQKTDVFRIANNDQVLVHLQLDLYAYNALIGYYPKAQSDILPGPEPLTYDFQSMVNAEFIGITNFILGNAALSQIRIIRPDPLKVKIKQLAQTIAKDRKILSGVKMAPLEHLNL